MIDDFEKAIHRATEELLIAAMNKRGPQGQRIQHRVSPDIAEFMVRRAVNDLLNDDIRRRNGGEAYLVCQAEKNHEKNQECMDAVLTTLLSHPRASAFDVLCAVVAWLVLNSENPPALQDGFCEGLKLRVAAAKKRMTA